MSVCDPCEVHFLCVGAQRSGTTWLAWNLRKSADFWIPPCKEVHYFTRSPKYPSPSHLACKGIVQKFLGRSQEAKTWRWLFFGYAYKWIARVGPREKPAQLLWVLRYFFGRPSDRWYFNLFRPGRGKICGEITPDYSLLDEEGVAQVVRLLPRIKVLLLMRDPLDRVLSQARYHMDGKAHPRLHDATEEQLIQFATAPGQIRRGNYVRIVDLWRKFVPLDNMHLVFYEDIVNRPEEVWRGILTFLGAEGSLALDLNVLSRKLNAATPRIISRDAVRSIGKAHQSTIRECADKLGGHAAVWAKRLEKLLTESA